MVKHIKIEGLVQGVGFRPFVCKEAARHELSGNVVNKGGAVEIIVSGENEAIASFIRILENNPPSFSKIDKITVSKPVGADSFSNLFETSARQRAKMDFAPTNFVILGSEDSEPGAFIPTDLGLCSDCEKEILDKNNSRRFHHCFTGCVKCGPRFTMLKSLPYDRANTTLSEFPLCSDCRREYNSPSDRRHSAENNCCLNCGPSLTLLLDTAINLIKNGGIIAVKGIGGYHLCCSPYIEDTVKRLRQIKRRETKPFAVMFRDVNAMRDICELSEKNMI